MASKRVGVLGGGQLGRMLAWAAVPLGVEVHVLDPAGDACAAADVATSVTRGDFKDKATVLAFVDKVKPSVVTVEIEHVEVDALDAIVAERHIDVEPSPETIRLIQDKYRQKEHLAKQKLSLPRFVDIKTVDDIKDAARVFGYPLLLKSKTLAYDGRGNATINNEDEIERALESLVSSSVYVEEFVPFVKELAVMVGRAADGSVVSYPCVETIQKNHICHVVIAPAQIDGRVATKARMLAEEAVKNFKGCGMFGVELFLLENGSLQINEIAPRVHNSGHYTIEGCYVSQFEQHIRAVAGLPLGNTAMRVPAAVMLNVLGNGTLAQTLSPCMQALATPGASLHWYNKGEPRAGRKMGHITITGTTMSQAMDGLLKLTELPQKPDVLPQVGIIMGSDSDLPVMSVAAGILCEFNVDFEITIVSAHRTPLRMVEYAQSAHERGLKVIIAGAGGAAHLPGMVASLTPLPVIGVPVALKHLDGVDSLHSIVQMPRGVPVATVAINNPTNAALLAVRILSTFRPELLQAMLAYQARMSEEVLVKAQHLKDVGWDMY